MKSTRFARHFEQNDQITTSTRMLCDSYIPRGWISEEKRYLKQPIIAFFAV